MIKNLLCLMAFAFCNLVWAQTEAVHNIPEFTFESGKKLKDMKVGYVTHGTLNANKSNAIWSPTAPAETVLATTSTSAQIRPLIPTNTLSLR